MTKLPNKCNYSEAIAILTGITLYFIASGANGQEKSEASLSIGAIKDQAETSAVRILAKYGQSLGVTDQIAVKEVVGDRGFFYTLSRQVTIDTADKGKFGGVSLRYGVKRYNVGVKTDNDAPKQEDGKPAIKFDGDKWMHLIPIQFGADADRNLHNRDYLLEVGYIPALYRPTDSCFKLGANPIAGISGQLGHRTRIADATAPDKSPEPSGSLRRIKAEAKLDFPLSCFLKTPDSASKDSSSPFGLLFTDIGQWQIIASTTGWRDFVENRSYRKHELTIRIPTGSKTSLDLRREIGAAPANFDTGAKFGANLTIDF